MVTLSGTHEQHFTSDKNESRYPLEEEVLRDKLAGLEVLRLGCL